MFRQLLAIPAQPGATQAPFLNIFDWHPWEISLLLEGIWRRRVNRDGAAVANAGPPSPGQLGLPADYWLSPVDGIFGPLAPAAGTPVPTYRMPDPVNPIPNRPPGVPAHLWPMWPHLIYAYMIENTRIYEIFQRVLYEYATGERLDLPSPQTQTWLRNTEELFYSTHRPFHGVNPVSSIRPDIRATRRNAYYRMFRLDLTHGADGSAKYPFERPAATNAEFIPLFRRLLSEVWQGITNANNAVGPNQTDDSALLTIVEQLREMLLLRRLNGTLSREEFSAVATMSWLHATVEANTPVVRDLQAQAASAEERLSQIGARVGVEASRNTESFFVLADRMSELLTLIEMDMFSDTTTVRLLYDPATPIAGILAHIITHWQRATGETIKGTSAPPSPPRPAGRSRPQLVNAR